MSYPVLVGTVLAMGGSRYLELTIAFAAIVFAVSMVAVRYAAPRLSRLSLSLSAVAPRGGRRG